MCETGECVQGDMSGIICIEIFFNLGALFCHPGGRDRHGDELLRAHDAQDEDFQQMLADGFAAVAVPFDLVIHLREQVRDEGSLVKIAENLCGGSGILGLEADAVNAQDIVFQ